MGAQLGEALLKFRCTRSGRAAARHQQQMLDAVVGDEVFGEERAQHPGTPGDQHRALGIQLRGKDQHDLSGMHSLAHVAEGLRGVEQAVAGGGQRREDTCGEQLG